MKKQYNKPSTQIVELKYSNILCQSQPKKRDVWSEVPGTIGDGSVWHVC